MPHALDVCEEAFTHNPWDVAAAREASEAAEEMGALQLAEWYVESVAAQAKDAEFFRHAAHVHERTSTGTRPSPAGSRSRSYDPNDESCKPADQRPLRQRRRSSARGWKNRSRQRAKPAEQASEDLAAKLERLKQEQLSPEDRWQKEIHENPNQIWPYLNLAEHHRNRSQFEAAEKILAQGLKANPKEPMLQQAYADVQMIRMKRAIEPYDPATATIVPKTWRSKAKLDQLTEAAERLRGQGISPPRRPPARKIPTCTTSLAFAWPVPGCTTRPSPNSSKPARAPR